MAKPNLNSALFGKLHKGMGHPPDSGVIDATGLNLTKATTVTVTGTHGHKPTVWRGTIEKLLGGTLYEISDLSVRHEEESLDEADEEDGKRGGPEDVFVTVSNPTDPSDPLKTTITPVP